MFEEQRYYSIKEVAKKLCIREETLWRWRQQGVFPEPILLGPRKKGFDPNDLMEWQAKRVS